MPTLSFNGQSFVIDGRRVWILGAVLEYARMPPDSWAARIDDARQAGFNTIVTSCPWSLHEPRRGRYTFADEANVSGFLELCGEAGLKAILRPGPFIGEGFDGGGIPAWLSEEPDVALRQSNDLLLDRTGRYFRKLFADLTDLQVTKGGPLLLVQVEHGWFCGHDAEGERYLRELARMIRECGINVPLTNTNNLWTDGQGTIDTWWGSADLLANLRQLRTLQPQAPRIVTLEPPTPPTWGGKPGPGTSPDERVRQLAEVLAAGGQPIVAPFHGGTNFGFLGGRRSGPEGGHSTTAAAAAAPLGEAGARGASYHALRQLATFASHFAHVFADLDPDHQPTVLDPDLLETSTRKSGTLAVVPQRGPGGQAVFIFNDGSARATTLLLENGTRLPVDLGQRKVSWYLFDADLDGAGRLDYANVCPFAIVGRRILVLFGPAKATALASIDGTPFERAVPGGAKPVVFEHKGITIVLLSDEQVERTYVDDDSVYVGIDRLDLDGEPRPARGVTKAWRITRGAEMTALPTVTGKAPRKPTAPRLSGWSGGSSAQLTDGSSARFASLAGPQSLPACGALTGYGWYRAQIKAASTKKLLVDAPVCIDRMHLFVDGAFIGVIGDGPGAVTAPFELRLTKGMHTVSALLDNLGRFADGNDLGHAVGLADELYECKPMRAVKPKKVRAHPASPLELCPFVLGASAGVASEPEQLAWSFTHARKAPIALIIEGAAASGTIVLNDAPVAYYAGSTGASRDRFVFNPSTTDAFKRGKNVIRFAPDADQPGALKEIAAAAALYEYVATLTDSWSFAKWEPPTASRFEPLPPQPKRTKRPCWWRCRFDAVAEDPMPLWLDTTGLSKGQVFVNGENVGRYFTATATGRAIGPQTHLLIPRAWLRTDAENELLIFDEHGALPNRARLVYRATGDLDE
jgi:hypothetical protein